MKIHFYLDTKETRYGHRINLFISHQGKKIKKWTGESCMPVQWDKNKERCQTGRVFPDGVDVNMVLDSMQSRVESKFREFRSKEFREPSVAELQDMINEDKAELRALDPLPFFRMFVENLKERTNVHNGNRLRSGTIRMYKGTVDVLERFDRQRKLTWNGFDLRFYSEYVSWLSARYSKNTVGRHVRKLKYFLREADSAGMPVNPFYRSSQFKSFSEPSSRIYLTMQDIQKIKDVRLTNLCQIEVRDAFVISCYSGLRFSDWIKLPEALNVMPGHIALMKQTKTGAPALVPIHSDIEQICERYRKSGFTHTILRHNAKVNKELKWIAEMAGLDEPVQVEVSAKGHSEMVIKRKYEMVQTHTGRRSFATNTYLSGFETKALSVIMGFSSEREFVKYLKVGNLGRANMLSEHWKKSPKSA